MTATEPAAGEAAAVATASRPAPGATPPRAPLIARTVAELLGTAALVTIVVGSGIQATALTDDVALQLLADSTATVFGLGVLIALLGPVSGAHFNPVVTLAEWWTTRRGGSGVTARELAVYVPSQVAGAICGAILADAMFGRPLVEWSRHDRSAGHLLLGEAVATAGLILLIFALARTDRLRFAPVVLRQPRGHHRPRVHGHIRGHRPRLLCPASSPCSSSAPWWAWRWWPSTL
ncbi:aquaporin [Streptomyces goshikiensis]|uniref:aquaporin n=1 Tax=Streptomyces goshikiensis TaxID=1942 RepID=UPI0036BA5C70